MERGRSSGLASLTGESRAEMLEEFDSLVRLHRPRIFRFILASLRNRETAENLTQDCFVKAYQAREQFRGASSVGTWFMQIAANLVRRPRVQQPAEVLEADAAPGRAMSAISGTRSRTGNSLRKRLALVQEQVQAIWAAAAILPARQRTVFLLRFVEDMDLLEIAEVTGMKEGTVKTHLFRALQSVRARLEGTK